MNSAKPPNAQDDSPRPGAFLAWRCTGLDPSSDRIEEIDLVVVDGAEVHPYHWSVADALSPGNLAPGELPASSRLAPPSTPYEGLPEILEQIRAAIGERLLIVASRDSTRAWWLQLAGGADAPAPFLLSLEELADLLFPAGCLPAPEAEPGASALLPEDLATLSARALIEVLDSILARHRARPRAVRHFALAALERCRAAFATAGGEGADSLGAILSWLAEPDLDLRRRAPHPATLLARIQPAYARDLDELRAQPPLPRRWPQGEMPLLSQEERDLLDKVHERALPREFAEPGGYRPGQHELARRILATLEGRDFLLVDAPTGTGKTLAYALPLLVWSSRAGVRVAISTYTRTLQDQAYYREIRRALRLLHAEGWRGSARISMLKGRANYICGRLLPALCPDLAEPPEEHLAWAVLALFALTDAQGDFDRLPLRAPLALPAPAAFSSALQRIKRECAAESGCCRSPAERARCAAHIARLRAERSHVVVTNHAFILSDPSFFARVVFDECDHLHEQAMAVVSLELGAPELHRELLLLAGRGRRQRGLLERIESRFPISDETLYEDPLGKAVLDARDTLVQIELDIEELDERVRAFLRWRAARDRERHSADRHDMLREYVTQELGEPLLATRARLCSALGELSARLAGVQEELAVESGRGLERERTRLARIRTSLAELAEGLGRWLPGEGGELRFDPAWFHDIEEGRPRGGWKLVRRILLPNTYLGRYLFPRLESAVLLSASTFLCGGFERMKGYLGLDLLEDPEGFELPGQLPPQEITPRQVECWRAPSVFDHRRILVAVPRDAPPYGPSGVPKARFLSFVVAYASFLAERSGGRMLVLFTNLQDLDECSRRLQPFLRARGIQLYYQTMGHYPKEELAERFRRERHAVLMGVDTFWYGVDFPGESLEQVVIVKLPYGAIDRFAQAQCAVLGAALQRRKIYLPQAMAMFRQGFGRLQRHRDDRGAVHILDRRVLEPRHRIFLRELPGFHGEDENRPEVYTGPSRRCIELALERSGRMEEVRALGLGWDFHPPQERESSS